MCKFDERGNRIYRVIFTKLVKVAPMLTRGYINVLRPFPYNLLKGENLRHDHVLKRLISSVSKENNLRPDRKIRYIFGLTRPILMSKEAVSPYYCH